MTVRDAPSDDTDQGDMFFPGLLTMWDELGRDEVADYKTALDAARDEGDIQRFLEAHPRLLVQHLTLGRRSWVIPKKRLGSEHETDFVIAQKATDGYVWNAVELERPQAKMFNKNGDPSAALTHALRQINDWREWLSQNLDYATRPPERSGLNLIDIHPELEGTIIIGRDADFDRRANSARRQRLERVHRVKIETYDWLFTQASERLASLDKRVNAVISRNPLFDIFDAMAKNPRTVPVAERIIRDVFGGISTGRTASGIVREEIEWEGVEIWPAPEAMDDNLIVPLKIVCAKGSPQGKPLQLGDWKEWLEYTTKTLDAEHSLIVTEIAPDDRLRNSLIIEAEGVWSASEWFPWYGEKRLENLHILVHLPPVPDSLEKPRVNYYEKRARVAAASEVFRRYIPALSVKHERESARVQEVLSLRLRDRVKHATFGVGTIIAILRYNPEAEVKVDFGEEYGVKHLVLRYAPLEKL